MKKLAVFFLSLIFVLSACNSNNSKERITKENIKIDPKDSHYVIKENSENKPQKIKVYKINKDGKEDITNNGVSKKENNHIEWRGTPDKYKDIKSLLGDTIQYKVYFKDKDSKQKELNIEYK